MEAAKQPTAATRSAAVLAEKKMPAPQEKKKPIRYPFWFGGSASSMAACVTHPLDLGT